MNMWALEKESKEDHKEMRNIGASVIVVAALHKFKRIRKTLSSSYSWWS